MEKLYTVRELHEAAWFPFKKDKIRKDMRLGKLNVIRFGNKKVVISRSEVKRYLADYTKGQEEETE